MRRLAKRFRVAMCVRWEPFTPQTHSSRDHRNPRSCSNGGACTVSATTREQTRRGGARGRRSGRPIRVLMFGWEFPPYQAGGLATATLGLVKGLLQTGLQVTLVVPFPLDGRVLPDLRLVSTAGLRVGLRRGRVPSRLAPLGGGGAVGW